MHRHENRVQTDFLKAGLSIVLKGRRSWIIYSTTPLVISLDFADDSFAELAMVHGVTEEELTLFIVVLTSLVNEATTKYFIDCFKFELTKQCSEILRKSDLIFSV